MKLIMENWRRFVLKEGTITSDRRFYGIQVKKLARVARTHPMGFLQIFDWLEAAGIDWGSEEKTRQSAVEHLNDKIYVSAKNISDSENPAELLEINFDVFWVPEGGVTDSLKNANKIGDMGLDSQKIGEFSIDMSDAKWTMKRSDKKWSALISKGESLNCEMMQLGKLQEELSKLKKDLGVGSDADVPMVVRSSAKDSPYEKKFLASSIEKAGKKDQADFLFRNSIGEVTFSISHKCIGFERFSGFRSRMSKNQKDDFFETAENFVDDAERRWASDLIKRIDRSTKGFYRKIPQEKQELVSFFVFGETFESGKAADVLVIGEAEILKNGKMGELVVKDTDESGIYFNGDIPQIPEDYAPIYKTRYGSNGTWLNFNDDEVEELNNRFAEDPSFAAWVEERVPAMRTVEIAPGITDASGENAVVGTIYKFPLRWYISPFSRNDGAEEI